MVIRAFWIAVQSREVYSCHDVVTGAQAFLKKLAMLPWPFLPAGFPFAELEGLAGAGFCFLGSGSSSEKDSQTVSSMVTSK
ncbi:hypothetical protein IAQ61_003610 [Plenodomus lingam]|uniref:uncharacterized protein n=1 Tax=Leptosphaeria maculans TaxID=5022 RepID=UPI0033174E55|nr:hypothetical protein IAQ61_003610 [Plenodomus lingam]